MGARAARELHLLGAPEHSIELMSAHACGFGVADVDRKDSQLGLGEGDARESRPTSMVLRERCPDGRSQEHLAEGAQLVERT